MLRIIETGEKSDNKKEESGKRSRRYSAF